MPPLQVPDEFGHLFRTYEVSTGVCLAGREVHVPVRVAGMAAKYPRPVDSSRNRYEYFLYEAGQMSQQAEHYESLSARAQ